MLRQILPDTEVLDEMAITFKCHCSRERVEQTLVSLGRYELEQIIEDDGKAEVVCHFCNEAYSFNKTELQEILNQAK